MEETKSKGVNRVTIADYDAQRGMPWTAPQPSGTRTTHPSDTGVRKRKQKVESKK